MIARKKKKMIIILSVALVVLILAVTLILLYINTDMFKSSSTLFSKYIGQNVENMDAFCHKIGTNEYKEMLKENKYTTDTQVKVNYAENIGTSSESTQNSINQLKLKINGQVDNGNSYNYQDISLLSDNETVSEVEYIQKENTYGIRLTGMFNQFILADNENLKELFRKIGLTDEELEKIPDKIEFNNEWKEIFQISEEEKQTSKTKYINIINSNISKDNFSKQKNQTIQIDGKKMNTNAYVLTMTKEQLNDIYLKTLEEVKQDEIILTRLDKIQTLLENYQETETINLRDEFAKKIEDLISEITKNNIGQDEVKITVYENNGITVSTMIQTSDYEMFLDLLSYAEEDYMQMSYKNTKVGEEKEKVFTYKKANGETEVVLNNTEDGKKKEYSLVTNEKIENNHCNKTIVAKYEDDSNRVETTIDQEINIVNNFEDQITLDEKNAINLSNLEGEQITALLNRVNSGISEKSNELTTTTIKMEDLWKVLEVTGLIKEEQILQSMGVTETERSRFNSKFEILQGENLENESILKLIEAVKDNLVNVETISDTEIRLELDRLNKNEEALETVTSFMEEVKDSKFNSEVEYDETTGLVSGIVLTAIER